MFRRLLAAQLVCCGILFGLPLAAQAYIYSDEYEIGYGTPAFSSDSFVMGQEYELSIPWIALGGTPDRDFVARIELTDWYGTTKWATDVPFDPPTSAWKPGRFVLQHVTIKVPAEIPEAAKKAIDSPAIAEGEHHLMVSLVGPRKDDPVKQDYLIIATNRPQPFPPMGRRYPLGTVYVTSQNVCIERLAVRGAAAFEPLRIDAKLRNYDSEPVEAVCRLRVTTEAGTPVFDDFRRVMLHQGVRTLAFSWQADYAGKLTATCELLLDGSVRSLVTKRFTIAFPDNVTVQVHRENEVVKSTRDFQTPIHLQIDKGAMRSGHLPFRASVFCGEQQKGTATGTISRDVTTKKVRIGAEPAFGYYRVRVELGTPHGTCTTERKLVATVAAVRGRDILLNGEPFIVKGTNCHTFHSTSYEVTDRTMKLLKEHGFNTVRGDRPPLWQTELAVENGLCWLTLLQAFSVTNTDEVFARFETNPLLGIRELTRQFVLSYRDGAGTVFWNSCNEVTGEIDEMLLTQYPVLKRYDPYGRPVTYANLGTQNTWRGQDFMSVNYYFGFRQPPERMQPALLRSINVAKEHNMPVIFTEFNSWWGPVQESGVMALEGQWQFGLDNGMSGGTLYQTWDNNTRHPGLLGPGQDLKVRYVMGEALKRYFADAEVSATLNGNAIVVTVRNKRPFTLRHVRLEASANGTDLPKVGFGEIAPRAIVQASISLPEQIDHAERIVLDGVLQFETHFGLINELDFTVFAE